MKPLPYLAFLDIAVVQGCILQEKDTGNANLNLKTFKIPITMPFIKQGKSTRGKRRRLSLPIEKTYESKKARGPTAPISTVSVRTDHYDHFPVYSGKQRRCQKPDCHGYRFVQCSKCDVRLCFTRSLIVLKNSMIRKHLFHIYQWLYWWIILMADSLEPYIILYRPLFFADFNLLLTCMIQNLFTEKVLSFISVSWPHVYGPNRKFWRFLFFILHNRFWTMLF